MSIDCYLTFRLFKSPLLNGAIVCKGKAATNITAFKNHIDLSVLPRVSLMYLTTKNRLISADNA